MKPALFLAALLLIPVQQKKDPLVEDLEKAVADFDRENGGFCGTILVAAKGKVLLEKGYGDADAAAGKKIGADALYDWASVSKQFTSAALLKLVDLKKVKLDDPLSKFYKDAPADKAKVTVRHLLNHTSGIEAGFGEGERWNFDVTSRESLEKMVLNLPMKSAPGEKWEYSNSAYSLAGALVERLSERPFEEFVIENLFKPAGMKDATFIGRPELDAKRVPKIDRGKGFPEEPKQRAFAYGDRLTWAYRGCGGVVATPRDLFQWDAALRGEKILSKAAKAELYKPALNNYAMGWVVRVSAEGACVEHGGNVRGLAAHVMRLVDENVMVALVCSYEPKEYAGRLAEALIKVARRAK